MLPGWLQGPDGLQTATWGEALSAIAAAAEGLGSNQFKAIAGKLADAESMLALKDLAHRLGSGNIWHEGGFPDMSADVRSTYLANTTVAGLEAADVILLIGTNPRIESPVYNARIRKSWLDGAQVRGQQVERSSQVCSCILLRQVLPCLCWLLPTISCIIS